MKTKKLSLYPFIHNFSPLLVFHKEARRRLVLRKVLRDGNTPMANLQVNLVYNNSFSEQETH